MPKFSLFFLIAFFSFAPAFAGGSSISSSIVAINCGSLNASGSYVADMGFSGGNIFAIGSPIDTGSVADPAPQEVYRSVRYGNFSYSIPGLTAGATYAVRLHFAEVYYNAVGTRVFNVLINGNQVLTNFDIVSAAGGARKANIQQFHATANESGNVVIQFSSVVDNASLNGIDISLVSPPPAPPYSLKLSSDKITYSVGNSAKVLLTMTSRPTNPAYRFHIGATFNGSPLGLTPITESQSYAVTPSLGIGMSTFVATVYIENAQRAETLKRAINFYASEISRLNTELEATEDPNARATLLAKIARNENLLAGTQAELVKGRTQVGTPATLNLFAQ